MEEKRGTKAAPAKTSKIKTEKKTLKLANDSSDDEAPEEVTFEDSKAEALRSMKEAMDTARR